MLRLALPLLALLLLPASGTLLAGEEGLEREPKNPRARELREEGKRLWAAVQPLAEKAKTKQPLEQEEIAAALRSLEDAALSYEKSLEMEWNSEANRQLGDALRGYFRLRALRVAAEPADEAAKAAAAKEAERDRRERLADTRKFVMDFGSARRYENLFGRCERCDGRGDLRSPFGDKSPCTACSRGGMLPKERGILAARWLVNSPLYRANSTNFTQVDRMLRTAHTNPRPLAPFVKSVGISGDVEDHGDWVRIETKEQTIAEPGAKSVNKAKAVYTLFRVGRVWYIYTPRFDRELIDIPDLPEPAKE